MAVRCALGYMLLSSPCVRTNSGTLHRCRRKVTGADVRTFVRTFCIFARFKSPLARRAWDVMKNEGVRGSEGLLQPDVGDAFFVVGIAERGVAELFVKGSHARLTVDDRTGAA